MKMFQRCKSILTNHGEIVEDCKFLDKLGLTFCSFCASETGVRSDVVARELNISLDKIRTTLEYLSSEGLVYTTTDDHYKFTDA
ncbi:hypothetical protein QUC31_019630 [Theobroma cacao]